jgi:hypothetical protein
MINGRDQILAFSFSEFGRVFTPLHAPGLNLTHLFWIRRLSQFRHFSPKCLHRSFQLSSCASSQRLNSVRPDPFSNWSNDSCAPTWALSLWALKGSFDLSLDTA